MPHDILTQELAGESDEFKDLINEELKNIQLAEQMKKKELEKMRSVAKEEVATLW